MAVPGFEKGRYGPGLERRLYPIATFNSLCARPLSWLLALLGFTPNLVSLLSLAVSGLALWRIADGAWSPLVQGALLLHLGLLLDHADGQVARRRSMGTTGGMYLDMVIDRVVEAGLLVAIALAAWRGTSGLPGWLPAPWEPLGIAMFHVLCTATLGVMMVWRYLTAYNDLLYLRTHLLATKRLPGPTVLPRRLTRRPLVPWVFNRDWVFLFAVVGLVTAQLQMLVAVLLLTHLFATVEKLVVFALRHKEPEGDATRILGKDYH